MENMNFLVISNIICDFSLKLDRRMDGQSLIFMCYGAPKNDIILYKHTKKKVYTHARAYRIGNVCY